VGAVKKSSGRPIRDEAREASVRARVDYGTVPFTVRLLMFWVNEWHRDSDWYTWTLQP